MGGYVSITKWWQCKSKSILGELSIWGPIVGAFLASWTCFVETESRRNEICLFIFPRFLETFWNYLEHRKYIKPIWAGENLLFALAMGIIVLYYHKEVKFLNSFFILKNYRNKQLSIHT